MVAYDTALALTCFTSVFEQYLKNENADLDSFEKFAIEITHKIGALAFGRALTNYDKILDRSKPNGLKVKDIRKRNLATTMGDVTFSRHVYTDTYNNPCILLDDVIDLAHASRISPYARDFLIEAGAEVSYAKSASLLQRAGGSYVSAHAVMDALRKEGELLAEEDIALAHDLYINGALPISDTQTDEVYLEADGTYIRLQNGKTAEIKAMVGYSGKKKEGVKCTRINPIRFGCIETPDRFWPQAIAALGSRFDLSKIKHCFTGFDGERWCKGADRYFGFHTQVEGHLDPFHLNRIIASCFDGDTKEKYQVMECIWQGNPLDAADLLDAYAKQGLTKALDVSNAVNYLKNNACYITAYPPSLGTMESEQQHLYKSRMASVPCGWSVRGASDMARLRSRKYSKRAIPKLTREKSLSEKRRYLRVKNIECALSKGYAVPIKSIGHGYEYPHKTSTNTMRADIKYHAGWHKDHWVRGV